MARYYGVLKGRGLGTITRTGTAQSGLVSRTNTWRMGVEVRLYCLNDVDTMEVYLTTGSEGSRRTLLYKGTEPEVIEKIRVLLNSDRSDDESQS